MSLQVPTTEAIALNIVAQLESSLSQTVPLLPKSFIRVLAKVLAGVFVLLWKYAGAMHLNMFIRTASAEETEINGQVLRPLWVLGDQLGEGPPDAATQAVVRLTVTVNLAGTEGTIAAGSQLLHPPTGLVFLTTAAATVPTTVGTIEVDAQASAGPDDTDGSGVIGNLAEGEELSFARPHPRVATVAVVQDPLVVEAVEEESTEAYRARLLRRSQRPPQGGAYADYRLWAEEPESILRAYPYTGEPGEVDVYVEAVDSIDEDGIAGPTQIAEALAAIELDEDGLATRRPATAAVNVYSITRSAFDLQIVGLLPDSSTTRAAIAAAVDEHLRSREPYVVGLSVPPRTDRVSQIGCAGVVHDIASANGASVNGVILIDINDEQTGGRSLNHGEKAKLGEIEWL